MINRKNAVSRSNAAHAVRRFGATGMSLAATVAIVVSLGSTFAALGQGAPVAPAAPLEPAVEMTYDLLGPAPQAGETITVTETMKIENGTIDLAFQGQNLEGTTEVEGSTVSVVQIVSAEGYQITAYNVSVTSDEVRSSGEMAGQVQDEEQEGELVGRTVNLVMADDETWTRELAGRRASIEQQDEIDRMSGSTPDSLVFPSEPVAIGHRWKIRNEALAPILGGSVENPLGSATLRFTGVEEYDGEQVAVIEVSFDVEGDTKLEGDIEAQVHMVATGVIRRSLATGLDRVFDLEGTFEMQASPEQEGVGAMSMEMSGELTVQTLEEVGK